MPRPKANEEPAAFQKFFRTVATDLSCDCGATNQTACEEGLDCRASPWTTAMRQRNSALSRAGQPARDAAKAEAERSDHMTDYGHIYDRLAALGIDPYDLKGFLDTLPSPRD